MLIRTLSDHAALEDTSGSAELLLDGYAHVLVLDVERLKLQRQIAGLAESGDPNTAGELRELSVLLRAMTRTARQLRDSLSAARERAEGGLAG